MKTLAQHVTGLASIAAVAASLLASGCGTHVGANAVAARGTGMAVRSTHGLGLQSRKPVRALAHRESIAYLQNVGHQLYAAGASLPGAPLQHTEADAAPAPKAPPAPPKADDVDMLLDMLSSYGYDGDRRHMVAAIHDAVYQYVIEDTDPASPYYAPRGWDPNEYASIDAHFAFWASTFVTFPVTNSADYATQALMIAQSRKDVKYYVWVSKPSASYMSGVTQACGASASGKKPNSQALCGPSVGGATPNPNPFANVMSYAPIYSDDTGFNLVKAVGHTGWMSNIGTKTVPVSGQKYGVIQDYFEMDAKFLDHVDLGNIVPVPESLYY
jgi:hypothetical protein